MTPTPTPIPWFTPTPLGMGSGGTPVLNMPGGDKLAEGIVQGYATLNQHGIFDLFWLLIVVLILLLGLWIVIRRLQEL